MNKIYYIVASIALSVILLWGIFFIKPLLNQKNMLKVELETANATLNDYQNILKEFNLQFQAHQELLKQKEHLLSYLYTKDDIIRLFDELLLKSSNYGITITEITPSVEELIALNKTIADENKPIHLDIALKMKANTINAGKFIGEIESQKYYKGFNFCNINNSDFNDPFTDVHYSFKAILGMLKDNK
ncbi:MAG: hypothetical protein ABIJ45_05270 [Candidatus Zixiibacteriota bacterium]